MKMRIKAFWLIVCVLLLACGLAQAERLYLPENITEIEDYAFYQCEKFTGELVLPASVRKIGEHAFDGCIGLSGTVVIPEGVIAADTAFDNTALKVIDLNHFQYVVSNEKSTLVAYNGPEKADLTVPSKLGGYPVTVIGDAVFCNMGGLTGKLTLPETVERIGASAFENCSGLTGTLALPDGLETIGVRAFAGCTGFSGGVQMPAS